MAAARTITRILFALAPVIDGVDGNLAADVIALLVGIDRPRLRVDERGHMLCVLIAEVARIQVRHRVADDAGEGVDARGAGAVIPGVWSPQRPRFLVADLDALAVGAVARRASLQEHRLAA